VAEATAGRFLRSLEQRGLARSVNATKGRVITEAGRGRLRELRLWQSRDQRGAAVVQAARATEVDDLIDLLHVRRAVETEAARVASTRATDAELAGIAAFAAAHVAEASHGGEISAPSMAFHRLVAEASHNRLLIAVALLLLDPANDPLEKLLERIALDEGASLDHVADHIAVAETLRRRDPAAADAAMRAHLDRMIRTVEAHRARPPSAGRGRPR
jgi:DNA-binding FadR family transcriptional regulator